MLRPREKGARQVKVAPIGLRKMVMVDGGEEEKATLANTPSKLITITGLIASPLKIFKKNNAIKFQVGKIFQSHHLEKAAQSSFPF